MLHTMVRVADLLPIENSGLSRHVVGEYITDISDGYHLDPVPVVPLDGGAKIEYILPDGHHRSRACHHIGRLMVPATILETDADLRDSDVIALAGMASLAEVRKTYHTLWLPDMAALSVTGIADLPFYDEIAARRASVKVSSGTARV